MHMPKRLLGLMLAIALLFSLTACAGQQQPSPTAEPTEAPTEEPTVEPAAESGRTLVVYFSATGNTEAVAGYIAETLNADTFVITPEVPYTSADLNWTDESSRVSQEYADASLRTVALTSTQVEGWANYDTVFIGYPIWWGIAAWPTSSFVAANDFTGKTVIPFTTSASSGLGESDTLLAEQAGTGTWLEGQRFRSSVSEEDVVAWVNTLDISK